MNSVCQLECLSAVIIDFSLSFITEYIRVKDGS
jgi:hypothetical protein